MKTIATVFLGQGIRTVAIVLGLLGVLAAAGAVAAERITVRIPPEVHVDPQDLKLRHLAEFTGGEAAQRAAVAEVAVGEAPDPGRSRTIDKAALVGWIAKSGVSPASIRLDMTDQVVVHRNAVTLSKPFLERIVTGYLLDQVPWPREKVRISKFVVNGETHLPPGKITYRITPPDQIDYLKSIPLTMVFYVDGIPREKTWVTVKLAVMTPVVVTRHPIGRNQPIDGGDIKLVDMDLTDLPTGVITDPEDVIGLRARRTLHIDTPLRDDLVKRPPLVQRGDIVKIVLESGGLKMSTLGEVKEKGRRGERISVVNLASNRRIQARVLDSKTVKVDF